MSKRTTGLTKRGNYWHVNKVIRGKRLYESTGTSSLDEAEVYLAKRVIALSEAPSTDRSFIKAATKYLKEEDKKSLPRDARALEHAIPFIGQLPLSHIHMGTLETYIKARKELVCNGTINRELSVIRRILNLASRVWRDELNEPWLRQAPLLRMLKHNGRKPYPITWEEQNRLMAQLPDYLANIVLFALNTGCRDQEMCQLKWSDFQDGLFILSGDRTKNGEERVVPLNSVAKNLIQSLPRKSEYVFTSLRGQPFQRIMGTAWKTARRKADLTQCRVHDLRHTFGRRLRAAGVGLEDREDLLGHKSNRITTHYSMAEIDNLIAAVEKIVPDRKQHRILRVA
ncbi:site-specific integrase [Cycloclasticus sp.]|uniref:tyrosine-type recombinase/integrase n=1 Tax=Cycloclasticus sp. TaxID=2024830 RepID=UPI000C0E46C9|nr:site-specific integrase [Cycloclasticus sp.]PHR51575.1 MAG: integrase [Cycloclasticus sp.]